MPAQHILDDLALDGIAPRLTPDGRSIELPAGRLNPAQRAAIVANRAALIAHLSKAGRTTSLAPAAPPTPAPAAPAAPQVPTTWCSVLQPWRAADMLYASHHWGCTTCCAAARGHSDRCPEGRRLHAEYATQVQAALRAT